MKIFILSTFLILAAGFSHAQYSKDYPERSRQILEWIKTGKVSLVAEQFDSAVAAKIDEKRLSGVWEGLLKNSGAFKKSGNPNCDAQQNYHVCVQELEFEKKKVAFRLVYGTDTKIKGIYFQPAEARETYLLPSYYDKEKVRELPHFFYSGAHKLNSILCVPRDAKGPVPVVIFVHGSGPNDRDETMGATKIFRDIAVGLATHGIASFRYDKRTRTSGFKEVPMDPKMTVKEEVFLDLMEAWSHVKEDTLIDPKQVYFMGHSFGGMILPRFVFDYPEVKGVIMLGANARPLEDLIIDQGEYLLSRNDDVENKEYLLDSLRKEVKRVKELTPAFARDTSRILTLPTAYWLDLRGYDPPLTAAQLKIPVLVLHGQRDYQVTLKDYNLWKEKLKDKTDASFRLYPKLNHFFIAGEGESMPQEYMKRGNVAKEVVDDIASFVKSGTLK